MTSNEATLCDAQPAAAEDDAVVGADVREGPQCEITVVECDRPHNTAHGVQQRQSDDLQLQQDQAPNLDLLAAAATDVHFAAGAGIQVVAGAGRVRSQRRIQNQVRRVGASGNEPANQVSVRRSGTRQIRRPPRLLDYEVPYFCCRKSH